MNEKEFWSIIDCLDPAGSNPDAIICPAIARLTLESEQRICDFQERLAEKLFRLDGESWAKQIGAKAFDGDKRTFDGEHFLHARCCILANGRAYYESVLGNPRNMPKDQAFPELLEIAPRAFKTKNGPALEASHSVLYGNIQQPLGLE